MFLRWKKKNTEAIFTAINTLLSQYRKCMNILATIWKTSQSKLHNLDKDTNYPWQLLLNTS